MQKSLMRDYFNCAHFECVSVTEQKLMFQFLPGRTAKVFPAGHPYIGRQVTNIMLVTIHGSERPTI